MDRAGSEYRVVETFGRVILAKGLECDAQAMQNAFSVFRCGTSDHRGMD